MSERLVSYLCVVGGVLAMSVGLLMARRRLRQAKRIRRKEGLIHASIPESWGFWFFQGFSHVTLGTRWMVAVCDLVFWVAFGVGLVSLGVRLGW